MVEDYQPTGLAMMNCKASAVNREAFLDSYLQGAVRAGRCETLVRLHGAGWHWGICESQGCEHMVVISLSCDHAVTP